MNSYSAAFSKRMQAVDLSGSCDRDVATELQASKFDNESKAVSV